MAIVCLNDVWCQTGLSTTEKLVLLCLADHAHSKSHCAWPALSRVATRCGLSRRHTQRTVRLLELKGRLERVVRPTVSSLTYRVPLLVTEEEDEGEQNCTQGEGHVSEKLGHNETRMSRGARRTGSGGKTSTSRGLDTGVQRSVIIREKSRNNRDEAFAASAAQEGLRFAQEISVATATPVPVPIAAQVSDEPLPSGKDDFDDDWVERSHSGLQSDPVNSSANEGRSAANSGPLEPLPDRAYDPDEDGVPVTPLPSYPGKVVDLDEFFKEGRRLPDDPKLWKIPEFTALPASVTQKRKVPEPPKVTPLRLTRTPAVLTYPSESSLCLFPGCARDRVFRAGMEKCAITVLNRYAKIHALFFDYPCVDLETDKKLVKAYRSPTAMLFELAEDAGIRPSFYLLVAAAASYNAQKRHPSPTCNWVAGALNPRTGPGLVRSVIDLAKLDYTVVDAASIAKVLRLDEAVDELRKLFPKSSSWDLLFGR